jgi:nitrous oxidase accessory protein NosD
MKLRFIRTGAAGVIGSIILLGGMMLLPVAVQSAAAAGPLYVSPSGSSGNPDTSCSTAAYKSISSAVAAASPGGTVIVCKGTYAESVTLGKSLTLLGRNATVDATGKPFGIAVIVSHVTVSGFTVENAQGEGIAVAPAGGIAGTCGMGKPACSPLTGITVSYNVVDHNNLGYVPPVGCSPPLYPGDCGGGILLDTAANSYVISNTVEHNVDGILVVDDFGPTHNNAIIGNTAVDNVNECGITLPSHNPNAATAKQLPNGNFVVTGLNPSAGGVFDNLVADNTSDGNGTGGFKSNAAGAGAGILLASAGPGTAVYDNTVKNNEASGNGLAGVVIHAHYLGGEYLQGNTIVGNRIGRNNVKGDNLDTPLTGADFATTGILVFSAMPISVTVSHNTISNDTDGIWATPNVTLRGSNTFTSVGTPVYLVRAPFGSALSTASVSSTSATLVGFAVPNGSPTTVYFQWGTSTQPPNYTATPPQKVGSGTKIVLTTATLSHLSPNTTYYFWLVITNNTGTTTGVTQSFTTGP